MASGHRPATSTDGRHGVGVLAEPSQLAVSRVLVVDDHMTFSEALAMAIDHNPGLVCVGTAATIAEGLAMVVETAPDVVLLDVHLPDGDGIEAIPSIRTAQPGVRVLVMTGHTDVDVLARAASTGASGFLPKENPIRAVLDAIHAARDDQMVVHGPTLAALLSRTRRPPVVTQERAPDATTLTARESNVLDLMGEGLDPHAIASRLKISIHTCRGYQKSIFNKLDAHSALEAVVIAARRGLLAAPMR
jgi:DNA-binding NarL/FixJ family response regulator